MRGFYDRFGASLLVVLVLSLFTGCATISQHRTEEKAADSEKKVEQEKPAQVSPPVTSNVPSSSQTTMAPAPSAERNQNLPPVKPLPSEIQVEKAARMSEEDMLDLALEYCEAANSFW